MRKSGFTIAPEAGTQRLRDVINKNLDEEQILNACRLAFEAGWDLIKLYFMIGLPTETDADVDGLVDLAHEILRVGRRTVNAAAGPTITLSASSFIPKAVTPVPVAGAGPAGEPLPQAGPDRGAGAPRGDASSTTSASTSFLEGGVLARRPARWAT